MLPKHNSVTEVYILLMVLLLGQTVTNVPLDVTVSDVIGFVINLVSLCYCGFSPNITA